MQNLKKKDFNNTKNDKTYDETLWFLETCSLWKKIDKGVTLVMCVMGKCNFDLKQTL